MKVEIVHAPTWFSGDRHAAKTRMHAGFDGYERRSDAAKPVKPAPALVSHFGTPHETANAESHLVSTFAAQALGQILTPKRPDLATASRAYRRASEHMFDMRIARAGVKLV